MAIYCLSMLVEHVPALEDAREFVQLRFSTIMAVHRMRRGRKTTIHPLGCSDYNEGSTAGDQKVLYDLLVTQLKLLKEDVSELLVVVGGDQSTVEKLRKVLMVTPITAGFFPSFSCGNGLG